MEEQKGQGTEKQKEEPGFICETCKTRYGHKEAEILKWACCGHEMTRLESLYKSDPTPKGA